jgi:hypothetical protein
MKWLFGVVITVIASGFPNNIAKINRLKSEAQKSYLSGDYKSAIEHYGILIDSFQISEEEILMNYANAAFLMTQKDNSPAQGVDGPVNSGPAPAGEQAEIYQRLAQNTYTELAQNASSGIQSIAFNQLGVMTFQSAPPPKPGKDALRQAQGLFKSALKTDQNNQQARFNYELVTKMLDQEEENQQEKQQENQQEKQEQEQEQKEKEKQEQEQKQEEQEQSDEDQEKDQSTEEDSENEDGDPKESEKPPSEEEQGEEQQQEPLNASPEKMEELKISEEKARMILEAMKNSEVQYIQQNQRKATKRPDSGKPDW